MIHTTNLAAVLLYIFLQAATLQEVGGMGMREGGSKEGLK